MTTHLASHTTCRCHPGCLALARLLAGRKMCRAANARLAGSLKCEDVISEQLCISRYKDTNKQKKCTRNIEYGALARRHTSQPKCHHSEVAGTYNSSRSP